MILPRLNSLLVIMLCVIGTHRVDAQERTSVDSIMRSPRTLPKRPLPSSPDDSHIQSRALLGALIGGASGIAIGFRIPCRSSNDRPACEIDQALNGLGAGLLVGNTLGAWGGGGRERCGASRGLARAAAGALIGSVPYATYIVATNNKTRSGPVVFTLAVTLPFLQAAGATRAVSGC